MIRIASLGLFTIVTFCLVAGCGTSTATSKESQPAGSIVQKDVAYGRDPAQKMDVYIPANAKDAPVILMVHGGGWRRGDKAGRGVVTNKVAHYLPKGYVVISMNYRMVPHVTPPEEATDVALALSYTQHHAATWGADGSKVVLMGHSAGANLVSLIAAKPDLLDDAGAKPPVGVIPLDSAAFNVVTIMENPHLKLYDTAFGSDEALWNAGSPILQLAGKTVPMLLVCGSQRRNSCDQAKAFADKANGFGSHVATFPIALSHSEINAQVGEPGKLTSAIDAFLASVCEI